MPTTSQTFEFYNQYLTKNQHTSQPSITMPQMVNGQRAALPLEFASNKVPSSKYYFGEADVRTHYATYTVEGAFRGTCSIEINNSTNPTEEGWVVAANTTINYTGLETTGGAGISGGFSGAVSRPTKTNTVEIQEEFKWARAKISISQGTLQAIKFNF